jgi:putative ABC transport system ATP-binding protein
VTVANRIETSALTVVYPTARGPVRALAHDGLVVDGGTSAAIMGPSGCGKSTFLALLAGLATPTTGSVTVGDTMLSALPARERDAFRRRSIGMVYQSDNLLPHLTVEENVGLQLAISRADRNGRTGDDVRVVLDRLGMHGLWERLPDQLSGGQRQRVAIARAVVCQPAIILADEPTGALDAANGQRVVELLIDVHTEIGATLVIVTHDPAIADHAQQLIRLSHPVRPQEPVGAGRLRRR